MKAIGNTSRPPVPGAAPSLPANQSAHSVLQMRIQHALSGSGSDQKARATDDEATEQSRVSKDWYGNANVFAVEREVSASTWKAGDISGAGVDVGSMTAKSQVHALRGTLEGGATLGADLRTKTLKAEVYGEATAQIVGAIGELSSRDYGSGVINGQTTVTGKAYVGGDAWGNASLHVGKEGVAVKGGLDLFAGAKASVEIEQCVGVAGHEIGSFGATAKVFAGIGLEASGELSFVNGRLKTSVEVGGSFGVGVGLLATVDIDVVGSAKAVAVTASAIVSGIVDAAQWVGENASSAAAAVWRETSNFRW